MSIRSRCRLLWVTAMALGHAAVAMAQEAKPGPAEPEGGPSIVAYFVWLGFGALAVWCVIRPARRE